MSRTVRGGDFDGLPRIFILGCGGIEQSRSVEWEITLGRSVLGGFLNVGSEALEVEDVFGVAILDIRIKLDKFILGIVDTTNNFGFDIAVGGNWPVHVFDCNVGV